MDAATHPAHTTRDAFRARSRFPAPEASAYGPVLSSAPDRPSADVLPGRLAE